MKVTCEYCGCYVDPDEELGCPKCGANLGDAVKAEEKRLAEEAEAERQKAAEEAAAKAAQEQKSTIIKGIASAVGALALGGMRTTHSHVGRPPQGMPPAPPHGFGSRPSGHPGGHRGGQPGGHPEHGGSHRSGSPGAGPRHH